MTELGVIEIYLASTLATVENVPGGVHSDVIPPNAPLPAIVFNYQSGTDVQVVGSERICTNALYQVKVVGYNDDGNVVVDAIADEIDSLLHKSSGTVTGGNVFSCVRERPIAYTEAAQDKMYRHRGGLYRIQAQQGGA